MGGEGSGRRPNPETVARRMIQEVTPIGNNIIIPNYSGIKSDALKTDTSTLAVLDSLTNTYIPVMNDSLIDSPLIVSGSHVGIGAAPTDLFFVQGPSPKITLKSSNSDVGEYRFVNSTGTETLGLGVDSSANTSLIAFGSVLIRAGSNQGIQLKPNNTTSAEGINMLSTGRVGINDINPSVNLSVSGGAMFTCTQGGIAQFSGVGNNNRPVFYMGPGTDIDEFRIFQNGYWKMGTSAAVNLHLETNNVIRMTILDTGLIGINHLTPAHALSLSGGTFFIANNTQPATPTAGGVIFVSGGALYFIGSGGTVTRIALA